MTDGRQPFLHDAAIALCAPTQTWSRSDGDMREPIDGVYHGDRRFVGGLRVACSAGAPEPIASSAKGASRVVFDAVLRGLDDEGSDPPVRLSRERTVGPGTVTEVVAVASAVAHEVRTALSLRIEPDFRPMQEVKAGTGTPRPWTAVVAGEGRVVVSAIGHHDRVVPSPAVEDEGDGASDAASFVVTAPGAAIDVDTAGLTLTWDVSLPGRSTTAVGWACTLHDPSLVVAAARPAGWAADVPAGIDPRLARWVGTALDDLEALRLVLPEHPDDAFLAAGAPWFFTLFGRDSLWAARMLLPVDVGIAASTLRVLARLQGVTDDPRTGEEPGKIPHELRAAELSLPAEGVLLPPLYYGTVDATALWVCLLVDAARGGMPEAEVRALVPALRSALGWIVRSTGDGFLAYIDRTGRGLANQGWKDSGDGVQWRDGTLAAGPIALCEVQGYVYEAAVGAAALLDRLGLDGADALRPWAAALRRRFGERFWVTTPEGRYPAIALDRDGRGVDTLTSNIGHLLGTGILDPADEADVAALLVGPSMSSGFGVRTLSTGAAGYWPLSYHGGSVWAHDSAIVAHGMARAGLDEPAAAVVEGLVAAADAFGCRMPELYSGDRRVAAGTAARGERTPAGAEDSHGPGGRTAPVPYPAACRPQAWAAAAAITCLEIDRSRR